MKSTFHQLRCSYFYLAIAMTFNLHFMVHCSPISTCDYTLFWITLEPKMYKASPNRRAILERSKSVREKEPKQTSNFFAKHLKRIYPITLQRSTSSSFSLSSISLSLSQNSTDSYATDSTSTLEQRISLALGLISSPRRRETFVPKTIPPQQQEQRLYEDFKSDEPKRCNWITKKSGKIIYIKKCPKLIL